MSRRQGDRRGGPHGSKRITHNREKVPAFGIEEQRLHPVPDAAELGVGSQSNANPPRLDESARDHAQRLTSSNVNMIRRVRHHLPFGLLSERGFSDLDRPRQIEQRLNLLARKKQRHSHLRLKRFERLELF